MGRDFGRKTSWRAPEGRGVSMRVETIHARGLGPEEINIELRPTAVIVGPTGSGKSLAIAAVELAATGGISGSPLAQIPRTNAGVLRFASSSSVVARLEGSSDQHGRWFAQRSITVRSRRARDGREVVESSSDADQSFAPARNYSEHSGMIGEHLSTLPEAWSLRTLLAAPAPELRRTLLGRLVADRPLSSYLPAHLPDWLRGQERLDPEAWLRWALTTARKRKSYESGEIERCTKLIDGSRGGKPIDLGPIQDAVSRATADLALWDATQRRAQERLRLEAQIAEAEAEIARRPRVDESLEDLASELAAAKRRDELSREIDRLIEGGARVEAKAPSPDDLETASRRLAEARAALESARATWRRAVDATEARRAAEATLERVEGTVCRHCGGVVAPEDEIVSARAALARLPVPEGDTRELSTAIDVAQGELDAARAAETSMFRALRLSTESERLAQLETERVAITARTTRELEQMIADLRASQASEQLRARLRAHLSGVEVGGPPTGDRRALVEALDRARAEERRAHEANAEIRQRIEAERDRATSTERVDEIGQVLAELLEIQRQMLSDAAHQILDPMRRIFGEQVDLQLLDERGAEDCQFRVGAASASTLSDGEQLMFGAALVASMYSAMSSKIAWRPLLLDRIESISSARRARFIDQARELVAQGVYHQAILVGCPDVAPQVRGLIRLGQRVEGN